MDPCDVPEVCTGTSVQCPSDLRNDRAVTFKCGTTCYLCGVQPFEISINSGGAATLGNCTFGKCREYVTLPWPACENQCVARSCPNQRDLSNYGAYQCNRSTGAWMCSQKIDVSASTVTPICPKN
jgi:hypothetical protein